MWYKSSWLVSLRETQASPSRGSPPRGKSKLLLTSKYAYASATRKIIETPVQFYFSIQVSWYSPQIHSDNWDGKKWVYLIFFTQLSCTSELFRLKQPRDSVLINLFHLCVIRNLNLKMLFSFKLSSNVSCSNCDWQKQQSWYFNNSPGIDQNF